MPGPGGPTVGRVNIRVAPDTSKFRRELGQSLETLERSLAIKVPTKIDLEGVRRSALEARRIILHELSGMQTIVNVTPDGADIRIADRRIDAAARDRTATIDVDVDRSALSRVQGLLSGISQSAGRLVGGAAGVGAIAGSLSALAAGAAAAVVPVVQLGVALAPAAGILATLPAAAATAAAALAPLALAFSGMGEALGAAITGDAEALTEAMEGLAPAAQELVRGVAELAPAFERLREGVQQNVFAPLVEPAQELAERIMPALSQGMDRVSHELGLSAANLATFLGHRSNAAALNQVFVSTARSLEASRGTMPALIAGFRELTLVGLPFIEQASAGVRQLALDFSAWAHEVTASGQAAQWIEDAVGVFQQLGSIASNVGGIISSVAEAAGDGGLLGTLEDLTGELDAFFGSAAGGAALEGVFVGLASVGSALSPVIASLGAGIGALAPMIGRLAEGFGPVLTSAIQGLTPALARLEPGLMAVIEGLGEGVDALVDSGALEDMGTALSDILTAVSPLLPVVGELAGVLGGALAEALIALAPGLQIMAEELAEGLAPVLPELSESFGELMEAITPLIPPLMEALVPILELLPPMIINVSTQMSVWAGMIKDLTPEIIILIGWIETLIGWAVSLATWWINLGTTFVEWSGRLSQGARDALRDVGEAIGNFHRKALGFFQALYVGVSTITGAIRRYIEITFGAARDFVLAAFSRMVSGARTRLTSLVTVATRIPYAIQVAVGHLGNLLYQAGRNVVSGLINGIASRMPSLRAQMSSVAATVRAYLPFSPAKVGPLRVHPPDEAGETIARMIADGMERGRRIVASAAGDVASAAVLEVDSQPLPDQGLGVRQATAEAQEVLLARLLEEIRERRSEIVLQVDSQEIARATARGERDLARR